MSIELIIITGLSGAGRREAVRCFEDLGYFCVDNLPPAMISQFVDLCSKSEGRISKVTLGIDIRGGEFFKDISFSLEELKKKGISFYILFLDATNDVLMRRFAETKRKHPLHQNVLEGIVLERKQLSEIKAKADKILDTSRLSTKDLWKVLSDLFSGMKKGTITLTLLSFGFKYGLPLDVDFLFDVRFLPDPSHLEPFKNLNGLEPLPKEYIINSPATKPFLKRIEGLINELLPDYIKEGKRYLTLALGSEEGRFRSPALIRELANSLSRTEHRIVERHRDLHGL